MKSKINLYKYRTLNKFTLDNVLNQTFWLSKIEYLNDPFDTARFYIENFNELSTITDFYSKDNIKKRKKEFIKSINNYGICSFSRDYDIEKMWSHYSNAHKGICIEYELNSNDLLEADEYLDMNLGRLAEDIKNYNLFAIKYLHTKELQEKSRIQEIANRSTNFETSVITIINTVNSDSINNIVKFLSCLKKDKWKYEKEVRFFKKLDSVDIKGQSENGYKISSLILGLEFLKNEKIELKILLKILNFAEINKIPVYRLNYSTKSLFKYDFIKQKIDIQQMKIKINKKLKV